MFNTVFNLKNLIWFCAIGLAVFSGYYSVFGISRLFSGGSWSIIGMSAMLELSKLVVVTFLHKHFKTLRVGIKLYMSVAIVVLMSITSIGVYGYLTNSYQETAKVIYKAQGEVALLDQKKKSFEDQQKQLNTAIAEKTNRLKSFDQMRISQQGAYIQQLTQKRAVNSLTRNISSVDKTSESLNREISVLTSNSFVLSDSISNIDQTKLKISNETFSSELGPLLYISRILNLPMDIVVNWFIIILVIVFDPLAISLVIAANHLEYQPTDDQSITTQLSDTNTDVFENELNFNNPEKFTIFDEFNNSETNTNDETDMKEFYDETELPIYDQPVDNGVENPWKPKPFIR
jgi:hypothetical protein